MALVTPFAQRLHPTGTGKYAPNFPPSTHSAWRGGGCLRTVPFLLMIYSQLAELRQVENACLLPWGQEQMCVSYRRLCKGGRGGGSPDLGAGLQPRLQ